jgi:DNA modification methylase
MLRRQDILRFVDQEVSEKTGPRGVVVDPFCGSGVLLVVAGRIGRRVRGYDIAPGMIKFAGALLARHGCDGKAVVADAKDLPLTSRAADMIVSSIPAWGTVKYSNEKNAMETRSREDYWIQMRQVMGEFRRILKPDGSCLLVQSPDQAEKLRKLAHESSIPVKFVMVPGAR